MLKRTLPAMAGVLMTFSLATQALAGTASDKAKAHFDAIAAGDVNAIVGVYADHPVFQWVGGPLDGAYQSKGEISTVWKKFTKAQGKLKVDVSNLQENANPKGATVSANVKFMGKNTIPVRYILTFRGDKLVNEVW